MAITNKGGSVIRSRPTGRGAEAPVVNNITPNGFIDNNKDELIREIAKGLKRLNGLSGN